MSNTYFQFKQFTVHQDQCAMKVCTDACLFGAWIADWVTRSGIPFHHILDIGTGTGLLSLMLAQQCDARVDAVEIDEAAAMQAAENFEASPWAQKCQVINGDIRNLHLGRKYSLIISNPPFFQDDLKSGDKLRNLALHSQELDLGELLNSISKNLDSSGKFAVLLPYHREKVFLEKALPFGYFPEEVVQVKQTPEHSFFRSMLVMADRQTETKISTLIIQHNSMYTADFTVLLKGYYLKL